MEVIFARIITCNHQQVTGAVHRLLGGGSIVDFGIGGELDERSAQSGWKLLVEVIQAGLLIIDRTRCLAAILDRGKDINLPVLIINQQDRAGMVIIHGTNGALAPYTITTER